MKCKLLLEQNWYMTKLVLYGAVISSFMFTNLMASDVIVQRESIDDIYLAIELKNDGIKHVFKVIEKETGLYFAYSDASIDKDVKITYSSDKASLREVLVYVSKNSELRFRRVNNTINISKKTKDRENVTEIITTENRERPITGHVADENNEGLPGVSILLKGTTTGSITDVDGNYSVEIIDDNSVLLYSFVGYITQEIIVGSRSVIDIDMTPDMTMLSEVVVTSLGVEKEERSLGYSISEVKGDEFVQARETNIANSLVGRVAGVNVSKQSTGPAGSTRVIIRGNTSLTGNNQPLYVVDGVPIDNQNLGSAGMWGGNDSGDGISSLNPDDIESMTVLKGGSAAALYGSRASNGVILVTTKTGKNSKGISVDFNTNYTFDEAVSFLDYQTQYGLGNKGRAPLTISEANQSGPGGANLHSQSFGGLLDGSSVIQFDGVMRPYTYKGNPMDQFYRTGSTFTNSLTVTGGNENANFRFSASDLDNESVIPNSGMDKNTYGANINFKLGKFSGGVSGTYILEDVQNSPRVSDVPRNVNAAVRWWPTSLAVNTTQGDPLKPGADPITGLEVLPSNNIWAGNPYWASYQSVQDRTKDRLIGNIKLRYDVTDYLFVQARVGQDRFNTHRTDITPTGQSYSPNGGMAVRVQQFSETNNDLIVGFNKQFGELGVNAMVGGNKMKRTLDTENLGGSVFSIPFFHSINNITNQNRSVQQLNEGINSVFYSAEVSYKSIYLTTTGRQDWFSSLDGASVFYPSVSVSAVLSDWFDTNVFDFLKVRGAWSEVGGATSPYSTSFSYRLGAPHSGFPQGLISTASVPNRDLVPLVATEFEIGADMRFFGGRLGVDVAYYDRKTEDDILNVALTPASGYTGTKVNIGEVTNKGFELLITAEVMKRPNFEWNTSFNYANNKSEVVSLVDPDNDEERIQTQRGRSLVHWVFQVEGLPYSQIMAHDYLRDGSGNILLDDDGFVQRGELMPWGTGVAPTTGGWLNSFKFGNFFADMLIDYQFGGYIASGTSFGAYAAGLHKNTLEGRGVGIGVVPAEDLNVYYERIANQIGGQFVYKSDYIKLRQLSLGYNFTGNWVTNSPIKALTLSFVARNLWIIHKETDNIDPEANFNSGNGQGMEFGGYPSIRSYGFNLNVKF